MGYSSILFFLLCFFTNFFTKQTNRRRVYCSMLVELDDAVGDLETMLYKTVGDDWVILATADNGGMVRWATTGNKTNNAPFWPASAGDNRPLRVFKFLFFFSLFFSLFFFFLSFFSFIIFFFFFSKVFESAILLTHTNFFFLCLTQVVPKQHCFKVVFVAHHSSQLVVVVL